MLLCTTTDRDNPMDLTLTLELKSKNNSDLNYTPLQICLRPEDISYRLADSGAVT